MKNIWIILLSLTLFAACYDDLGNYDYEDIDVIDLTFPGNIGKEDTVIYMGKINDSLLIRPEIGYQDMHNLKYSWEVYTAQTGGETFFLSDSKNLEIRLTYDDTTTYEWTVGRMLLKYVVTDTVTLQSQFKQLNLIVRSPHPTGVYVLHGNELESDVATLENDDFTEGLQESLFEPTYYSGQMGEKLTGEGRSICWHRNSRQSSGLFIFTQKDATCVDLTSFEETISLEDMFEQRVPENLSIKQFIMFPQQAISVLYCDSEIYEAFEPTRYGFSRISAIDDYGDKQPGFFNSDGGTLYGGFGRCYLGFSREKSSFYMFDFWSPEIIQPCPDDPKDPVWNPNDMGGQELIGIDYGIKSGWYGWITESWSMFRDADKNIHAYRIKPSAYNSSAMFDQNLTIASTEKNAALQNMNCFSMSQSLEGLGYFSTPDAVYSMDVINDTELAELFKPENPNEKITEIKLLKANNLDDLAYLNETFSKRLGKSLYVMTWDGTEGRIYRIPVDSDTGKLDESREIEKFEGLGKIHDLTFRIQ